MRHFCGGIQSVLSSRDTAVEAAERDLGRCGVKASDHLRGI